MRDLFRLIAVGLMSLAVVSIAMLYSAGGSLISAARALDFVAPYLSLPAPDVTNTLLKLDDATKLVSVARPDPALWVGLAGLPGQVETVFDLPADAPAQSGTLRLWFEADLATGNQGLLAVSLNGVTRGQVVLEAGKARHSVEIALTQADLESRRLVLHMAGRSTGQVQGTCAAEAAAVITLDPESRLDLIVASAYAATSKQTLVPPADPGATTQDDWSLVALGADPAIKTFRGTQKWSLDFENTDLQSMDATPQILLSLMTTPLRPDQDWLVRLVLNGTMVETRRLAGDSDRIDLRVALPADRLVETNQLTVELVDATPELTACGQAEQLQAQLLHESALIGLTSKDKPRALDGG